MPHKWKYWIVWPDGTDKAEHVFIDGWVASVQHFFRLIVLCAAIGLVLGLIAWTFNRDHVDIEPCPECDEEMARYDYLER